MPTLIFYETKSGACPVQNFLDDLINVEHKESQYLKSDLFIKQLKRYGFDINQFQSKAIKPFGEGLWELKPGYIRIFFYYSNRYRAFVILHAYEKDTEQAPPREVAIAKDRQKEFEERK
ncbi:MAG TPA: hypothetical protein DCR44_00160 [Acholeplasmatales bacterium]|nr:MAG: hypothetical protein A2Y16_01590 [Tenericutes bacterium GWF2_57_13]HAQ55817.1 hypothetical protein [Acholeplasmatales bacterium]